MKEDNILSNTINPLITIIVPVYNEEKNIEQALTSLIKIVHNGLHKEKNWSSEIIIVDDGSTDESYQIISKFLNKDKFIRFISHNSNQGKGAALSSALKAAKGKICIIQDGDLEYDPHEIPMLLEPIIKGKTHVVYGSRFLRLNHYNGLWFHLIGNLALSLAGSLFLRRRITDIMTCYKAFRIELLQDLISKTFDVEPEITVKLLKNRNNKYMEFPISYNPRLKGKKIRKIDGFISLRRLIITIRSQRGT